MAKNTEVITLGGVNKTTMSIELVGTSPLILNKKTLSFEREQIFAQSHKKGTKIPDALNTKLHYNLWEKLITSITWRDEIEQFDDYEDYTEEMYHDLLDNNAPCILARAFTASFYETFVSFGYKESTGRNGTDFKRSVKVVNWKNPITFAASAYEQVLTPNTGINKVNVLAQHTLFKDWKCEIEVSFVENIFPRETVLEIINNTGEFIGVGTKRADGFGSYRLGQVKYIANGKETKK